MQKTRTGKPTAHLGGGVQIVKDSDTVITMFIPGARKPLAFTPSVRPEHYNVLAEIIRNT